MNKISDLHYQVFKEGSKTYFNSSVFFPKRVRYDVFALYGFVRVADNFVDAVPQDAEGFYSFRKKYREALSGKESGDPIVDVFLELAGRKGFNPSWTEAFLESMEMDITKQNYNSLDETLKYIYGSAEVIGLYMASILDLPKASYPYAEKLGRAMQYINFIRDVEEDRELGRRYLPLEQTDLKDLSKREIEKKPESFRSFIRHHLSYYRGWQMEAEKGYAFIPKRYLIPIKTAADMYNWTGTVIDKYPFIVFERKVKPSKARILFRLLGNIFFPGYAPFSPKEEEL